MQLTGHLSSFPLPELLQWARTELSSGVLVFRRSGRETRIYFEHGDVVACRSDDPAEHFGRFLLLQGYLESSSLTEALRACERRQGRLGEVLVELGILTAPEVREALRRHIEDLVCGLFLWARGVFYFLDEPAPREPLDPAPISSHQLALEGARWADELRRIRLVFVHDDIVLLPGTPQADRELSPLEERILRAVDGRRTLGELYEKLKGSHFRFLEAAFALTLDGFLEIGEVGDGEIAEASRELDVYDVLLERATEEERLRWRSPLSFDLLESFYPVWLSDTAEEAVPEELRGRIDGETPLRVLLLEAAGTERSAQGILEELGRGTLALLPRPLSELEKAAPTDSWWQRLFSRKG